MVIRPKCKSVRNPLPPTLFMVNDPNSCKMSNWLTVVVFPKSPGCIVRQGPRILPFKEKPEGAIAPQSYARPGSEKQLGIGSPASRNLGGSPGMVVRFKSGPVFEAQVNPIG